MKLFYRTLGEGPPLIILHGLLGMSDNWLSIARALAGSYQLWVPDQRNHGRSPHSEIHSYPAMAGDLLEFMEEHAIRKPVIMGHSMGGKVAMRFALEHPERIEKLIVVDMAPGNLNGTARGLHRSNEHAAILDAMQALQLHSLRSRTEAEELLAAQIPSMRIRQFVLKNLDRTAEGAFRWHCNLPVLNVALFRVMEAVTENAGELKSASPPFKTLFIRGELSPYILPADEASIQALFPGSVLAAIPGAGHWVHAEQAEQFLKVVQDFLAA